MLYGILLEIIKTISQNVGRFYIWESKKYKDSSIFLLKLL